MNEPLPATPLLDRPPGALGGALEDFLQSEVRRGNVTAVHRLEPRPPVYADWPEALDPRLVQALQGRGIEKLYRHQAEAISSVLAGKHTVVVTPTASGKTMCYNLPVIQRVLEDRAARALYMFPTKALSQDQLAELVELDAKVGSELGVFTYDGDTPSDARRAVRTRGHVVITNPDMLHTGILPHHTRWARFFSDLRYVVLDELHTYRGVFGSHIANVLRRLQRICRFHGSDPVFILCSATIANPQEHAEALLGQPVAMVDRSGAPTGQKTVVFYNPPIVSKELGIRRSYLSVTRRIAAHFFREGVRGIIFASSRLNVEVLTRYLKDRFERTFEDAGKIRGYRGGYLPSVRREIERGLRAGKVLGVISTNALELGIDIGALELAILSGYPGTIASTWQQAGRAGRRQGESAVIMVGRSDPLDQFLMQNPSYFFEATPEHARINPENLSILLSHLKCACFEIPMELGEGFGKASIGELLEYLAENGVLYQAGGQFHWSDQTYPADGISLRSASPENFVVMNIDDEDRVIAEVDWHSAPSTVYEDAIYLVEGRSFHVKRLDYDQRRVYVRPVDVDYYTDAITDTSVDILDGFQKEAGPGDHFSYEHGEVHVAWRVSGFKKIKFDSRENVGFGEVNLPDHEMHTTSFWVTFKAAFLDSLPYRKADLIDGLSGLAYVLQHVAPLYLMCDVRDLDRCVGDRAAAYVELGQSRVDGRIPIAARPEEEELNQESWMRLGSSDEEPRPRGGHLRLVCEADTPFEPTLFLYDNFPGGIGFSPQIFDIFPKLLEHAEHLLSECQCEEGCPSCVGPPNEVGARAKAIALHLLRGARHSQEPDLG
jgi:DEAD/DEAH box helicase domain-containing protein